MIENHFEQELESSLDLLTIFTPEGVVFLFTQGTFCNKANNLESKLNFNYLHFNESFKKKIVQGIRDCTNLTLGGTLKPMLDRGLLRDVQNYFCSQNGLYSEQLLLNVLRLVLNTPYF